LHGYIDSCTRTEISGWAIAGEEAVELVVEVDGVVVGQVRAAEPRADLGRNCGFRLAFARPLETVKKARVYCAGAGEELVNSPFEPRYQVLPPSAADLAWTHGLELPPLEQMRLIGSDRPEIFVAQGSRTADVLRDGLCEFFGDIQPSLRILDFGCGVGRSLLPLARRHAALWHGCDVNNHAIAYLNRAAPEIKARVSLYEPPLPFPDDSFDCVISISVWTHLPIGMHLPWLAEIRRVLRRGGLALISTSGPYVMNVRRRRGDPGWEHLHPEDLLEAGVIYRAYKNPDLTGVTASYGLTAHDPAHVQRVWSTIMPVLKTSVRALESTQDLHMLTKL
jgi:SAM-dependent methyltransferase